MMLPEAVHPWIVLATIAGIFAATIFLRRISLDALFLSGLLIVMLAGVLTPSEAFSGFSNSAVLTIVGLLAVATGLRKCGVIDWLGEIVLGGTTTIGSAVRRLALVLLGSSPFLLNTALVAMCIPMCIDWCRKHKVSPSRIMLSVSYLTILGGVCTLIGTSTTLVVQAQLVQMSEMEQEKLNRLRSTEDANSNADAINRQSAVVNQIRPMGFFEIGQIGLPCALVGAAYMLLIGSRLLPDRKELIQQLGDQRREYLVEMVVQEPCRLIGQTVESAGLRHLPGLFLIEIDRGDEIITPVTPKTRIAAADRLVFTGLVETIVDLERIPGLVSSAERSYDFHPNERMQRHLTEVVLSPSSPLVGLSIKEADFRKLYAAAVVAVHRNGSRLPSKLGDIVLESGDTLLIQTKNKFADSYRNSRDFYLVSSVEGAEPRQHDKAPLAIAILIGLVAWLTAGSLFGGGESWANPPICALLAMMLMIVTRCMRFSDVRNTLDVQLILTIALALGMGEAMRSSGAAAMLARFTTSIVSDPFLVLVAIYVTSMILTEMISNAAVAAIMIPIAISVATSSGSDARPFIMAVAIAASLAFITPIGYQTNLMVMGPGGYRPSDYLKCGLPLSLLVAVTAIVMLRIVYGF